MRIVDDDNGALGTYCGSELSGKVVLVNGNYALITFHSGFSFAGFYFAPSSGRYPGFQLTISFTENQNGTFK